MRTDHLIRAMAADEEIAPAVDVLLPRVILVTGVAVGAVFLVLVGPRPDPAKAIHELSVVIKQVFPVILAVGGFGAVVRLARPGAGVGRWTAVLAAVPLVLLAAVVVELTRHPERDWYALMMGKTVLFCLTVIPLMSLPILAASLWALRRGGSTRPSLTGAVAGLLSGGTATALYAIHCIEDSPLFYATWYTLALLVVTSLGAIIGSRVLRW